MKIVCIHQPDFAPYLGFFHRLLVTTDFIYLDNVQFIRRGWQHRDKIKSEVGGIWLTLSLQKGSYYQEIRDVKLSTNKEWIDDSLDLIRQSYWRTPYFEKVYPKIEDIYRAGYTRMIDFNLDFLRYAINMFDIKIRTHLASDFLVSSTSSQRLVDLVLAVGGDSYITGMGSRDYLEESLFEQRGIKVVWQNFTHPVYPQLNGGFLPMLSCLDLFFNCGEHSAEVLRSDANG
jgi:hypothetical protein